MLGSQGQWGHEEPDSSLILDRGSAWSCRLDLLQSFFDSKLADATRCAQCASVLEWDAPWPQVTVSTGT